MNFDVLFTHCFFKPKITNNQSYFTSLMLSSIKKKSLMHRSNACMELYFTKSNLKLQILHQNFTRRKKYGKELYPHVRIFLGLNWKWRLWRLFTVQHVWRSKVLKKIKLHTCQLQISRIFLLCIHLFFVCSYLRASRTC